MAKEINAGLQIVYRKLSEMHPNPKNPRKQGDEGIVPLAESIEANPQFFEARPILLSDRTGQLVIIGGERRWEAAQYLEMENAPSILFHGLTEEQEDEIMVRDNTHSGVWDSKALSKIAAQWGGDNMKKWAGSEQLKWDSEEFVKETIPELAGLGEEKTLDAILNEEGALARERVIITFPSEKKGEIADMLGLDKVAKVVYRFEELRK